MLKRHPLSDRFHQLLKEIGDLHDKKRADYGSDEDPFANVNQSKDWGIEPWIAACLRIDDKIKRLQSMVKNGRLRNESAVDSMRDIAAYALIANVLYENRPLPRYQDYAGITEALTDGTIKVPIEVDWSGLVEAAEKLSNKEKKCLKPRKSRKSRKA